MSNNKNRVGRPVLTFEERELKKQQLLQKIEPYLKTGLSVNKALREAKIHNSEFYKYMEEDEGLRDKIAQFRNFTTVILNNTLLKELLEIVEKQKTTQILEEEDRKFLWRLIKSNSNCKQEWGRNKVSEFDHEREIEKVRANY